MYVQTIIVGINQYNEVIIFVCRNAEFERNYTNDRQQLRSFYLAALPTLETVFDLLKRHSAKWDDIGRCLRITYNDREILYNERISAEKRLERVIDLYINGSSLSAHL